jgi:hypothetical protein
MQTPEPAQAPTPTIPPAPGTPAAPGGPTRVIVSQTPVSPAAILEAFRQQREELRNQLERLEDQRRDIAEQLRQPLLSDADKKGLEARIATIDTRITDTEKQIGEADANVARASATPGAVVRERPPVQQGPPEEFWIFSFVFLFVVALPLTIAYARRIWRRSAATVAAIPQEIYDRFTRIDQAVDSVAIEVERIGEGQRFLTRMYNERFLGAGPAERVEVGEREREQQRRDT